MGIDDEKFEAALQDAVQDQVRVNDDGQSRRVGAFDPWFRYGARWSREFTKKELEQELTREREKVRALEESMSAHDKSRAKVILERDAALEKVRVAREALKFYADGANPTPAHPYKEFGCGCCASSVEFDTDGDYDSNFEQVGDEVKGRMAREALKTLGDE